jgi:glutamate-1-semialdehyde 2,1-aminomutase
MGGGLPVGAYGASNELMSNVSPEGPVYQAGTLSGNPVAMAAGIAQLSNCLRPGFYEELSVKTLGFVQAINKHASDSSYPFKLVSIGSIFWLSFEDNKRITSADQINPDMSNFNLLHAELLTRGIYIGPSGYEVGFISQAHSESILDASVIGFCDALDAIFTVK